MWVLINLSHYHLARWTAFGKLSGHDASVIEIASQDAGFAQLEAPSDDARIQRVTLFPSANWRKIRGPSRRKAIWKALDNVNPDVVCVNGWSVGGSLASLQWCVGRGRRSVVFSDSNVHDSSRIPLVEQIKSKLVRLGSAALVAGRAARAYLAQLGFPVDRIFVGYDAVDNAHFTPKPDERNLSAVKTSMIPAHRYFLAAARFEEKKNHRRLLEAYAAYKTRAGDDAWPLVILGDGCLRPQIEARRVALGFQDCVLLPGFASYEDLPAWYQLAGCFVHPSTTEQWGLVVNEAMAAGLPLLVSNRCGCVPDLVEDGVNGYTFDPLVPQQLADLMYLVAHGGRDTRAMGRESARIVADWGPDRFASGLSQAVEAALRAPPKQPNLLDMALLRALSHR